MKRILAVALAVTLLATAATATPATAATSVVTKSGCIAIDREWLNVKRELAGVDAVYKVTEVASRLKYAATVWSKASSTVRAKGGIKVAAALTSAASAARALRVKLLKADSKGAVALSDSMAKAMEKTVLPACAALF